MVWTHGKDTLLQFIDNTNRLHPTIKFIFLFSPKTVYFLDTTVHLINKHIKTKVYTKPTHTHQYIFHKSCHSRVVGNASFLLRPMAQALARWRTDVISAPTVPNLRLHEPTKRSKPYLLLSSVYNSRPFIYYTFQINLVSS